jgi:beta-galactosidase
MLDGHGVAPVLAFDVVWSGELTRHIEAKYMKFWNAALRLAKGCALIAAAVGLVFPAAAQRLTLNFNPDWKFIKSDPAGAQTIGFDDAGWTNVSAPHTYNDIDTFDHWSIRGHHGEQGQWGGRTWYRKTFTIPQAYEGKKIYIEFEAVRQVAEVYLNGQLLGTSKTGFIPFGFDLTPHLQFGKPNVLAIMCDNRFMKDPIGREESEAPAADNALNINPTASPTLAAMEKEFNQAIPDTVEELQANQIPWNNPHWHPAHGGIYRNVRLYVMDPLHISLPLYSFLQTAGPYVYATDISANEATINIEVPIENGRSSGEKVNLVAQVVDRNGKTVLTVRHEGEIVAGANATFNLSGVLPKPELWESDYPYLYHVVCSLEVNGRTVDTSEVPLGIRTVKWTVDKGFFINGHHEKLHGWGQKPTDEWPGLGAAQPVWMHFYTLNLMKQAGGNWVRWGHCAAGPEMIEACDELGLMVEQPGLDGESDTVKAAWKLRASGFRDMIIYYRNDPAILIWEGGNQKVTREHAQELRGYMDKYDPHGGRAYAQRRADQTDGEFMDVCIGTEGGCELKKLPVVEGEYDREESPRRVWDDYSPPNFGYPEAKGRSDYILTSEQYAVNELPQYMKKIGMPQHCGGANWIFSDTTSGGRDAAEVDRAGGEVDGERLPKEAYYVCSAMFNTQVPQVHIIGHWTYPAGTKKTIYVTANRDRVELFVNGKSVGCGSKDPDGPYIFVFPNVTWAPGEIKAVAYSGDKAVATHSIQTAGPAAALRMTPITNPNGGLRADGSDILLVDVEAVDSKGKRCPTFQQRVDFDTTGEGIWRGGYNSGKTNSINNPYLDLECGINRVAVRATQTAGKITVRATCKGLKSATLTVRSNPVKVENGYAMALPVMPAVTLPTDRPSLPVDLEQADPSPQRIVQAGKFITDISYSGPTLGIRVVEGAQDGKKILVDRDELFSALPTVLEGADYVEAAEADARYNAVDLMEMAVKAGSAVFVAHDERLAVPDWLSRRFKPVPLTMTVDGHSMRFFQHVATKDESLTLGTNTEDANAPADSVMYLVFVNGH